MKPVKILIGTDEDFKKGEGTQIYAEAKDEDEVIKILERAKSVYVKYRNSIQ